MAPLDPYPFGALLDVVEVSGFQELHSGPGVVPVGPEIEGGEDGRWGSVSNGQCRCDAVNI